MLGLHIERASANSLTTQLTAQIRALILQGKLKGREKLPPTRLLAHELDLARNVVIQAYEQLLAEGYLASRAGAGTYVADLTDLRPDRSVFFPAITVNGAQTSPEVKGSLIDFHAGNPDLARFPRIQWAKHLKEACLEAPETAFAYGPAAGEKSFRAALAHYLLRAKGIDCPPEQLLIVSGAAQGLDLVSRLCGGLTRTVAVEDPCIWFAQSVFARNGLQMAPVGVDELGLRTGELPPGRNIGLIYVVPSHQFPLGGILPIRRRLELLAYAEERNALIIEDDYDGEFRYRGEPIQPLWRLAPDRVFYLGTFSKIISPGLRLGYLVVPPRLLEPALALKEELNMRTPSLEQLAMARFLETRSLDRHVFRMKKLYEMKRRYLIDTMAGTWGNGIRISGENAGMHLVAGFADHEFTPAKIEALQAYGVGADWVEDYAMRKGFHRHQLILGYGNLDLAGITEGIRRLREAMADR